MISILLIVVSAALTHVAVRGAQGVSRVLMLCATIVLLGLAFYLSEIPGGFWAGVYTLTSLYFMTCLITPWVHLAWLSRRVS